MPDGLTVGIRDFAVVHNAGHAVRVRDILCSIQVIYRTLQRGVSVAARDQIPGCVQVHLGQQNAAENAVILQFVGIGVHGVGFLVVSNARGVGAVGFVPGVVTKGNGDNPFAGVDKGAAAVGRGDVGIVVGVSQPNRLTVQRFCDFKGIRPLAENGTGGTGFGDIRPIAVITAGRAALHNDELALVALSIVKIVRAVGVSAVVDDLVSSICLAFNLVLVIPASRNIPLLYGVPLKNLEFGVTLDLLFGFAVDFVDGDFYRPLIVFHRVIVRAVGRNRNGLVATKRAGCRIEAMRDGDLIVAECNIGKLRPRRGNSSIHHALRFILQLPNGRVLGSFGSGVCFGLAGERSFLPAERTGASF